MTSLEQVLDADRRARVAAGSRSCGRMSVVIAIAGLFVVAVHELGHFTAAKLTGMRAPVHSVSRRRS